jgi:hypothetical protein
MIEKLIATLFLSREITHREHLKASRRSNHMILGEFYDSILDATDKLTEIYQGRHGIIDDIPILTNDRPNSDVVKILEYHLAIVEKLRYTAVDKNDAVIQAVIDEVCMVYLQTLYKLRNLK